MAPSNSNTTPTASKTFGTAAMTAPNTPTEEIQQIFAAQKRKQLELRRSTARERIAKLKKLKQAIESTTGELEEAVYKDFRKAPLETDLTETLLVISEIKTAIREIRDWMAPKRVGTPMTLLGSRSEVVYEPKGTVLIIAPWNYPFQLAFAPLIASIAAGNTNIIKPSEYTPHTSAYIRKLVESTFTRDECAVVEGDHTVSTELLKLSFDHIFFTGSTPVGKIIMEAAAKTLATVTLELGGKSPVIIDESSDMKLAAKRIMWGKVVNGGQTCVAPDYLLVPEGKVDEFVKHAKQSVEKMYASSDNPSESKDFSRIVSTRHYQRLTELLHEAMESGAKVEMGGASDASENYIAPTLISGVSPDIRIMQEEIFGPLLPILTYRKLEEAVDFVNSREKPLALYVFSKKNKNIKYVLQNTSSGGAAINDVLIHLANHNLPFGGANHSGHGSYHGHFGFRALSHERGVLKQSRFFSALDLLYPPYTGLSRKLANLTKKLLT